MTSAEIISFPSAGVAVGAEGDATLRRFTLDGDDALERHVEHACARVLSGVRGLIPAAKLEAVLLGGGYGRGEGGVLRTSAGDQPYNDLEFYVLVRGNRHCNELRYGRALEVLGEILTQFAGIEVEFKITSRAELQAQEVSMFSYDLISGHRVLNSAGFTSAARSQVARNPAPTLAPDASPLAGCAHHGERGQIPVVEATRLLMNRGTGLLLAAKKLACHPLRAGDAEFVCRNIAKAQLACGDAVLTAHGRYSWSCRERHRQLERIALLDPSPWHDRLLRHHAAGVEFKLHPSANSASREELTTWHAEVCELMRHTWLWLEARRLNRAFLSARGYAQDSRDKLRDTPMARNLLLNLRLARLRPHLRPPPWRHPRQRVFNALALLLWDPAATSDAATLAQLQRELSSSATTFAGLLHDYQILWARVR